MIWCIVSASLYDSVPLGIIRLHPRSLADLEPAETVNLTIHRFTLRLFDRMPYQCSRMLKTSNKRTSLLFPVVVYVFLSLGEVLQMFNLANPGHGAPRISAGLTGVPAYTENVSKSIRESGNSLEGAAYLSLARSNGDIKATSPKDYRGLFIRRQPCSCSVVRSFESEA